MGNSSEINDGIYERLVETWEEAFLSNSNSSVIPIEDFEEKKRLVYQFFRDSIKSRIGEISDPEVFDNLIAKLSKVLVTDLAESPNGQLKQLRWVSDRSITDVARFENQRPLTPISEQALFTNARGEPRIDLELERELATADRVEILVSFIKISGLRLIDRQLMKLRDRNVPVRLITTTYMGATDKKAIDRLVNELGVDVRIDLQPSSNRLHAKAWLFHRDSGFSTAYIGSSNMSHSALTTGSEWNVRLAQKHAPELFSKFQASFETYWESDDYKQYSSDEYGDALEESLARQSGQGAPGNFPLSNLEVTARPHQLKMLEELQVAREIFGHNKNLVVAATGTGKTVLSAFDYKRLIQIGAPRPALLFVAHRQEILKQAMATFRQVLGDSSFGELLVAGHEPKTWRHVFASIQSLNSAKLRNFPANHFAHLVIDEFHHAEAKSYRKLFELLEPQQVVGLTATPERADGINEVWNDVFGGRISSELRLWDALSQDLIAPFHYFALGEDLDYSQLPWVAGRYEAAALNRLVTSNTFRNKKVLRELNSKVSDVSKIRALIFCVSVEHANQVAMEFTANGLNTKAVTGKTENRGKIIQDLRTGAIRAIATVDVFNEGVDIPEVDTILLLRPTESPVVFLQQIGRGLRKAPGKDQVLILDFIGAHRSEYRIDKKFAALSGKSRSEVLVNFEQGFPYLPSGSSIQLDEVSQQYVLDLMKRQISPGWQRLVQEIRDGGSSSLTEYLSESGRELFELYRGQSRSWAAAVSEAKLEQLFISEVDEHLLKKTSRLLHLDDSVRLEGFKRILSPGGPSWGSMSSFERRLASMLFWNLFDDGRRPWDRVEWESLDEAFDCLRSSGAFQFEIENLFRALKERIRLVGIPFKLECGDHPFLLHATYSRAELLGGLGYARLPGNSIYESGPGKRTVAGAVTGVNYIQEANLDVLFVNLQKGDSISESVRYHDYALSPKIFHWDSQNSTSINSEVGQRYVTQKNSGRDVIIAVREKAKDQNGTIQFKLLGPVDYLRHEGSKPISVWWQLRTPMDPDSFEIAAAAKVS
jgi:superfamily II DNA or RNA helicase/HKD family nuclease